MMRQKELCLLFALLFVFGFLTGCAKEVAVGGGGIPEWVAQPRVEGGIAVTECVLASGDFSLDRKEATANARQSLAQEIETRVQSMEKTYQNKIRAKDKTSIGSNFESVSRQLTEQTLQGSRATNYGYEMIEGKKHFCVMLVLGGKETEELFKALMEQSNRNISARDQDILYQEFRAERAQKEMEEALKGEDL